MNDIVMPGFPDDRLDKSLTQEEMDQILVNLQTVIDNNQLEERDCLMMTWGVVAALGDRCPPGWQFTAMVGRPLGKPAPFKRPPGLYRVQVPNDFNEDGVIYIDVGFGQIPEVVACDKLQIWLDETPLDEEEAEKVSVSL